MMDLSGSRNLKELPDLSTASNLCILVLNHCSSLVELPSSIGNMTNLVTLDLYDCTSLVKLHSSIGNLHNLLTLQLEGCSKLKTLPINLTGCSPLEGFPEISTKIRTDRITELDLSNTMQEIGPWVKEMSRLRRLVIKGCTKLVSLPQLPDSLQILDADNCESLQRLDCSFNKTNVKQLHFVNCFKLNQEARDLLTKTEGFAIFPGEKVPTYFTYRATGSSLSMKCNGFDTHLPTDSRFKACMLVKNGDVGAHDWLFVSISYRIKNKLNGVIVNSGDSTLRYNSSPTLKKHLVVFEFETTVTSAELVFEFEFNDENWEIEECGLRPLQTLAPSC